MELYDAQWTRLGACTNKQYVLDTRRRRKLVPNDVILGDAWLKKVEIQLRGAKIASIKRLSSHPSSENEEEGVSSDASKGLQEDLKVLLCIAQDEIDVPEVYRRRVEDILIKHEPKKDVKVDVETKIILKDETPVTLQPRRLAVKEKQILDKQLKEWLDNGIIRPSESEYASPVLIVPKKDGSYRVCVDYRALNSKIIRDRFPMPLIEDKIDALVNFRIFSVIDLKNGFFHVPMAKNSIKYTSFVVPNGQFEFVKSPFGLCNSPTSFLRFVDRVFKNLERESIVMTYMDDLIIPGVDYENAFNNLVKVLDVAAENGLQINLKKCKFLQRSVEYLGHIVEAGTVRPAPTKIQAVQRFPEPKTITQVKSFLGLTGYFRKFVKGYSKIAYPLYEVRDGQHFFFGEAQRMAFRELKAILATEPILRIYNPDAITELHTDASKIGYGAVLLQRKNDERHFHPVHFMSRKLSDAEKKWSSYELEALAIIEAVKKFRVYLLGLNFKIVTDCQAFQQTLCKQNLPAKVARWALILEEFDYVIEHRSGDKMKHVDALSRNPVMIVENTMLATVKREQENEERFRVIKQLLRSEPYEDYLIENEVLMKKVKGENVVVLPTSMQFDVLRQIHENGHFGVKKMKEAVQADYYIPKLDEKLERLVECCVPCILAEKKRGKKEGLLQPIPKGDKPLDTFHIDHLGPMTVTSKQYKYLLVVVDGFTKFSWIFPTKTTKTQEVISKLRVIQQSFGNPRRLVSDRGTAFTSIDFQNYCNDENIQHILITAGVPRGNGQVERINGIIIPILTKLSLENPDRWYQHISGLQMCLNSTYQRSVGMSPFEVLIGIKMNHRRDSKIMELLEQEAVKIYDDERDELRQQAKENILKVQKENKQQHDKKATEGRKYREGDLVVIRRTQFGPGLKIKKKFLGPYKVVHSKGGDRYEVVKVDDHEEGPRITSSSSDNMKPYGGPSETEGFRGWPNAGA